MAWSNPPAVSAGDDISASDHNTYVKDNIIYCHSGKPATAIDRDNSGEYTIGGSFADVDATNLSITLSTTAGRALIVCTLTCYHPAATTTMHLDVALDGTRLGGSDGIVRGMASAGGAYNPMAFQFLKTGLSVGSHTFTLQAKSAGSGRIVSSSANKVHFAVVEI